MPQLTVIFFILFQLAQETLMILCNAHEWGITFIAKENMVIKKDNIIDRFRLYFRSYGRNPKESAAESHPQSSEFFTNLLVCILPPVFIFLPIQSKNIMFGHHGHRSKCYFYKLLSKGTAAFRCFSQMNNPPASC